MSGPGSHAMLRFLALTITAVIAAHAPLLAAPSAPQAPSQEGAIRIGGAVPVQVIAGRLVVACDVSTAANRIPVNLFLEVEGRHGLQLHNRAAASLRAESADGQPRPITIHFPDFTVTVPGRELGDEELFEEFTKYHSAEMGENALVGSIGVEVLKEWTVTFDLGEGQISLAPPAEPGPPPGAVSVEPDGTVVAPLTLIDDMAWLPVRWSGGEPGGLMLGSSLYDTRIDQRAAQRRSRPAGDVGPIKIGGIDLHEYVAFRPEPVVQVHPDGVVGVTGINLLENLSLTIDRARRTLRLRPTAEPSFPAEDLQYFQARADEDPEAILTFLTEHGLDEGGEPKARLAHEAARLLLDYRLMDMAERSEVEAAVKWIFDTMKGDLRTTRMLDLMKEMFDAGEADVVVAAGKLGVESGRDDRYPNAVHEVHGMLGRTLLDRAMAEAPEGQSPGAEATQDAFRHLLSAAFGLSEDGRINFDLGRYYESQGRHRRAYSRYVQAAIRPEAGGLAIEALQRVQPFVAEEGEAFSVDTVERMIAGKVRNFGAASRFVESEEEPARRIVLAEFFTNGHLGNEERGGAIGGALGFEGLLSHFGPEEVAFLEYHLPSPQPDALCSSVARARAEQLGVEQPAVIVLDGQQGSPGAGKWRDAEAIYTRARRAVIERMAEFADYEVAVEAEIVRDGNGERIVGKAFVVGPDEPGFRVQVVLAEKGVLYPGTSGVIVHRWVARTSLVGDELGVAFEADDFEQEVGFEMAFDDVEAGQLAFLEQLETEGVGTAPRISTRMDPNQARVVAYLYDERTGAVLASGSAIPAGVEGEDAEIQLNVGGDESR